VFGYLCFVLNVGLREGVCGCGGAVCERPWGALAKWLAEGVVSPRIGVCAVLLEGGGRCAGRRDVWGPVIHSRGSVRCAGDAK